MLAPDFFQPRSTSDDPLAPVPDPPLPAWRSTTAVRRGWQDTLQSRIDEQNSVIDGMRAAVNATEAANLQTLRDGLVMAAAAAGGSDLDRAADWVTRRFLIDAKMDPSQKNLGFPDPPSAWPTSTLLRCSRSSGSHPRVSIFSVITIGSSDGGTG